MPEKTRFVIAAAVLAGATLLLHAAGAPGKPPVHRPLSAVPEVLSGWRGADIPMTRHILEAAGVDDYVNREYTDGQGRTLQLYVGYYDSQRTGDLIHSPRNCLPAAGWEWIRTGRFTLDVPPHAVEVNDFLIARGLERQVVLYWYHGRGRTIASEYTSKFWMMADALTRRRTDGALVRIAAPAGDGEGPARARAVSFVQALYPHLNEFIPD